MNIECPHCLEETEVFNDQNDGDLIECSECDGESILSLIHPHYTDFKAVLKGKE